MLGDERNDAEWDDDDDEEEDMNEEDEPMDESDTDEDKDGEPDRFEIDSRRVVVCVSPPP